MRFLNWTYHTESQVPSSSLTIRRYPGTARHPPGGIPVPTRKPLPASSSRRAAAPLAHPRRIDSIGGSMTCAHRHVVVTGASSGIGRATAQRLAAPDWHVYAGVRKPDDGD